MPLRIDLRRGAAEASRNLSGTAIMGMRNRTLRGFFAMSGLARLTSEPERRNIPHAASAVAAHRRRPTRTLFDIVR